MSWGMGSKGRGLGARVPPWLCREVRGSWDQALPFNLSL